MWKKILLISCAGLVVIGLAVSLVGLALGGGYGSFNIHNGQVTYQDGQNQYPVGWLPGRWYGNDTGRSASNDASQNQTGAPSAQTQSGNSVDVTQLKKIDFSITAGYVIVVPGEEASLAADGPMEYLTHFENGEWHIYDTYHNIDTRNNRFYANGQDITTHFTLTLPKDIYEMDIKLGMGTLTIQAGFAPYEAELKTDLGTMDVYDLTATELTLKTELGSIGASNMKAGECELNVALGSIEFEGEVGRKLEADCDLGSIIARVPRPSQYGWEADSELGHISIDGQSRKGSSGHDSDSISPYFDLKCELGNISIIFT